MGFVCSGEVAFGKEFSGQSSQSDRPLLMLVWTEGAISRPTETCELSRSQSETHATKTHNKENGKKVAKSFLCGGQFINTPGILQHPGKNLSLCLF